MKQNMKINTVHWFSKTKNNPLIIFHRFCTWLRTMFHFSAIYQQVGAIVFRYVFCAPKSIQATVTLLENLHIILEKTPRDYIRTEVLPMLFTAFESSTIQVQVSGPATVCKNVIYFQLTLKTSIILSMTKNKSRYL